jgi:hypothetical protein
MRMSWAPFSDLLQLDCCPTHQKSTFFNTWVNKCIGKVKTPCVEHSRRIGQEIMILNGVTIVVLEQLADISVAEFLVISYL